LKAANVTAPGLTLYNHNVDQSPTASERQQWLEEFEAAARRPLAQRMKYSFIRTYKPVLDDAPFRAFETMADYRAWCEANLPEWLGYGR